MSLPDLTVEEKVMLDKRISVLTDHLIHNKNAFRHQLLTDRLRRLCHIAQCPMPDIEGKTGGAR